MHSLLRLPLNPYLPNTKIDDLYSIRNKEDVNLIKELDMIIIDEVSMVRCDMMDAMDDILRYYRKNDKPFGGVQIVMFGDLYQLMPVVKDEDWNILKQHYKSPYFFSSDVYKKLNCITVELTHIYRQQDSDFISILNNIRDGKLLPIDKKDLQTRYIKDFEPNDKDGYVRLTTHNWMAKSYNNRKLESIRSVQYEYKAYIEGFFPYTEYPVPSTLKLKVGARVMFVRNDSNGRYVNGTLGVVEKLGTNNIVVATDEGRHITVERQTWDFDKYVYNKLKKELEIQHCGSFRQYPIRLAWCMTVHKSQGLTFDKVVIDVGRAFTFGQVYVALSRCRTFAGIVLVSEIKEKNVLVDAEIEKFLSSTNRLTIGAPDAENSTAKDSVTQYMNPALKRTYYFTKEGLTAKEIVSRNKLDTKEIIYGHLNLLVGNQLVDIMQLLSNETIDIITQAINKVGVNASFKAIKRECPDYIQLAEIRLVHTYLQNKNRVDKQTKKVVTKDNPPQKKEIQQDNNTSDVSRSNKRWNKAEMRKLIIGFKENKSFAEIALQLHRTETAVASKLQELGVIYWNKETGKYIILNSNPSISV